MALNDEPSQVHGEGVATAVADEDGEQAEDSSDVVLSDAAEEAFEGLESVSALLEGVEGAEFLTESVANCAGLMQVGKDYLPLLLKTAKTVSRSVPIVGGVVEVAQDGLNAFCNDQDLSKASNDIKAVGEEMKKQLKDQKIHELTTQVAHYTRTVFSTIPGQEGTGQKATIDRTAEKVREAVAQLFSYLTAHTWTKADVPAYHTFRTAALLEVVLGLQQRAFETPEKLNDTVFASEITELEVKLTACIKKYVDIRMKFVMAGPRCLHDTWNNVNIQFEFDIKQDARIKGVTQAEYTANWERFKSRVHAEQSVVPLAFHQFAALALKKC